MFRPTLDCNDCHAFSIFPIFSTSRPKLLTRPYVSCRPDVGLSESQILRISVGAVSKKSSGFCLLNAKFTVTDRNLCACDVKMFYCFYLR